MINNFKYLNYYWSRGQNPFESFGAFPYIPAMAAFKIFIESLPRNFPELELAQFHPSLDSTNLEAKRIADAGVHHTALLVAETQTAGRGRMNRSWESPAGLGLYFSLLLRPELKAADASLITLAAGCSLGATLKELGASPLLIKWPNDLLLKEKKVAGILCEMKSTGSEVEYVVVGVGINLSQRPEDFSKEVSPRAGSLDFLTGRKWDQEKILNQFLQNFFPEIKNLEKGGSADLIRRWEQESGLLGQKIRAVSDRRPLEGTVAGLSPQGHLRLQLADGSIENLIDEETTLL
jgi:BirA family biotin operon repressor/biotin-[acetyl-CoA-carboxylase] ligase